MKWKKRTYSILIFSILVIYLILLMTLTYVESEAGSKTIVNFGDAFWYSIATLTTVGYGDLTPVTPAGRTIGILFMILATTILVALVSSVVGFMTGRALPLWHLSRRAEDQWYYFADATTPSRILAAKLKKEEPDAQIIFGISKEQSEETPEFPCTFLDASPTTILEKKRGKGPLTCMFFLREDDIFTNFHALQIASLPAVVYARTRNGQDTLPGHIHLFHSSDCCARQYWRTHPLTTRENHIVLIGFGYYGMALLERAILTNVLSVDQHVVYHIFGNAEEFLRMHHELSKAFSINEEGEAGDSLLFHDCSWKSCPELIHQADRIILCQDNEKLVWENYWNLKRFYATGGQVHVRSSRSMPGILCFGTSAEIYTPAMVLRTTLNTAAVAMNDLYRRANPEDSLDWDELNDFLRESKIAAADHLLTKIRILMKSESITTITRDNCLLAYHRYKAAFEHHESQHILRMLEHMRWIRFYTYYNWTRGDEVNSATRQHPNICPYEEIPQELHRSFDFAWELLGQIAPELPSRQ